MHIDTDCKLKFSFYSPPQLLYILCELLTTVFVLVNVIRGSKLYVTSP